MSGDVRLDCEALYVAIDRERRQRRIPSQREVLRQAGIGGPSLLTRLGQGHPPAVDNLVRLLVWLDTTDLGPFISGAGESEPVPWEVRAAATGGGPCPRCGKPFYTHVCLSCSPDYQTPGRGCGNCRNTGMDQTPCLLEGETDA